jgi:hypothetical protein
MWTSQRGSMQGENKDRWTFLCEQAAVEQDPRLLELTRGINDLRAHDMFINLNFADAL